MILRKISNCLYPIQVVTTVLEISGLFILTKLTKENKDASTLRICIYETSYTYKHEIFENVLN